MIDISEHWFSFQTMFRKIQLKFYRLIQNVLHTEYLHSQIFVKYFIVLDKP